MTWVSLEMSGKGWTDHLVMSVGTTGYPFIKNNPEKIISKGLIVKSKTLKNLEEHVNISNQYVILFKFSQCYI